MFQGRSLARALPCDGGAAHPGETRQRQVRLGQIPRPTSVGEPDQVEVQKMKPATLHPHQDILDASQPHFRHVKVLKENIKDVYEYSYAICRECKDYGECDQK